MDDSAIISDEVVESYDVETNFNKKKQLLLNLNFWVLLAFFLITRALLKAVSIYCYLIKFWANRYYHLTWQITNQTYESKITKKIKDIDIKTEHTTFSIIWSIWKILIQIIKIVEKSYKNFLIYYVGYMTIKDLKHVKIYRVSPLYFIFNKANEYFEEINENKI